jgi:hypothetical protein
MPGAVATDAGGYLLVFYDSLESRERARHILQYGQMQRLGRDLQRNVGTRKARVLWISTPPPAF